MKGFPLRLFLFMICIVISSVDKNEIHLGLELQTIHQETVIKENYLHADDHMSSDIVDHTQDFLYTNDLKKICHGQVNEFIWKCPTTSDSEEKVLKFRTMNDAMGSSILYWHLKSMNEIDVVEIEPGTCMHQIEFKVNINQRKISLGRLYPTYPEVSGFEILQFIANLHFNVNFLLMLLMQLTFPHSTPHFMEEVTMGIILKA